MQKTMLKLRTGGRMLVSRDRVQRLAVLRRMDRIPTIGTVATRLARRLSADPTEFYSAMQKHTYEAAAAAAVAKPGDIGDREYVVGSWHQQDEWPDYNDYLMRYVPEDAIWTALDFGCGPGRNIRRWTDRFARIDGADIAQANLDNARRFLAGQIADSKRPNLFLTGGADLGAAPDAAYDFVFSTIAMQHICVYTIRRRILEHMFRTLKPGGRLSLQMGFGVPAPDTVDYSEDFVEATGTNRHCDVAIADPSEPRRDLEAIGFTNFEHWLRPTGPGDSHPQWIFFTAIKPL